MQTNWIAEAVNYQINLRSLAAREPRNAIEAAREVESLPSPLQYVTRNLDALKTLGVNLLHLMPPFRMGVESRKGIGSPYATSDFLSVDPEYGTMDDLKAFIRAAHQQGFRVILGMVPNHTSRDHVWMTEHPDYYVRDEQGTALYDLDWSDSAKLDYTNPSLRTAMLEIYDFWLSILGTDPDGEPDGVDGFRVDMAHFINDKGFWDEALPELFRRHAQRQILFMAECYGAANNLDLFARGFNAAYDDDFYKVCAYCYAVDEQGRTCIRLSPDAVQNYDFRDQYEAFQRGGIAAAMEACLMKYERELAPGPESPRLARYIDNHDEGRGVFRFGEGAALAAMQLLFFSGHAIPFLLTGQEFGAVNRPPIHERFNLCDKGPRVVRGVDVEARPGIEFEGNLFARGREMRQQWYNFYRDLIQLRAAFPEFALGDFRLLEAGEQCPGNQRTVIAFERRMGEGILRCAVNLGPDPRKLNHASLFARPAIYGGMVNDTLQPFTAIVVRSA